MKKYLFILLIILACEESTINALSTEINEYSGTVYDWANDSVFPDFRQLSVFAYSDSIITILTFNDTSTSSNKKYYGDFIYFYDEFHDMIGFGPDSFRLSRDIDSNGHFESLLYSSSVFWQNNYEMHISIPTELMPDIAKKRIWAYSMDSKDLIPDNGHLSLYPIN